MNMFNVLGGTIGYSHYKFARKTTSEIYKIYIICFVVVVKTQFESERFFSDVNQYISHLPRLYYDTLAHCCNRWLSLLSAKCSQYTAGGAMFTHTEWPACCFPLNHNVSLDDELYTEDNIEMELKSTWEKMSVC